MKPESLRGIICSGDMRSYLYRAVMEIVSAMFRALWIWCSHGECSVALTIKRIGGSILSMAMAPGLC